MSTKRVRPKPPFPTPGSIAFIVQGRVQGVNFRSSTQRRANSIGLTGFVTNASDGTVQGEAQGSQDAIDDFVQHLHKGPSAALVTGVEQSDIATKAGESSFRVQRGFNLVC